MTEDAPDETPSIERRAPEAVFGLLGNEVRVDALRALGETPREPVSFSALFERVAVEDSGNFSYHLDRLLGSFVRKTDAGYELTHAGKQIVGAMLAGTYTANASVDPIDLDWDCGLCGGPMRAAYEGERAKIRCADCGKGAAFPFPPGSLDQYDRAELPAAFARWLATLVERTTAGFCSVCAGRLDGELARLPGGTEDDPKPSRVRFECGRCGNATWFSGSTLVTYHPAVEGFFFEHDLDLDAGHASRAWTRLDVFDSRILSEDPRRIEVRFGHGDDLVTAEIAPDATVENVQWSSR